MFAIQQENQDATEQFLQVLKSGSPAPITYRYKEIVRFALSSNDTEILNYYFNCIACQKKWKELPEVFGEIFLTTSKQNISDDVQEHLNSFCANYITSAPKDANFNSAISVMRVCGNNPD